MVIEQPLSTNILHTFTPKHKTFIGIDSDGCVFNSMEIKQKECCHTALIHYWHLEKIETEVRQAAEYIGLYSHNRGRNRFINLYDTVEMLRNNPAVRESGIALPEYKDLRTWIDSGTQLTESNLEQEIQKTNSTELQAIQAWSRNVTQCIENATSRILPFTEACTALQHMNTSSDVVVVSQTPQEALLREWETHQLISHVQMIAGLELGTKEEHLRITAYNTYPHDRILLIGDSPGDLNTAQKLDILFYPIHPGNEEQSWKQFHTETYPRFLNGIYSKTEMNAHLETHPEIWRHS